MTISPFEERLLGSILKPFLAAAKPAPVGVYTQCLGLGSDANLESAAEKAAAFNTMFVMLSHHAFGEIQKNPTLSRKLVMVDDMSSLRLVGSTYNFMACSQGLLVSLANVRAGFQNYERAIHSFNVTDVEAHAVAIHEALVHKAQREGLPLVFNAGNLSDEDRVLLESLKQSGYEEIRVKALAAPGSVLDQVATPS